VARISLSVEKRNDMCNLIPISESNIYHRHENRARLGTLWHVDFCTPDIRISGYTVIEMRYSRESEFLMVCRARIFNHKIEYCAQNGNWTKLSVAEITRARSYD